MRRCIPNLLTAARLPLAGLVVWLLVVHRAHGAAFSIFVLAFASDLVDGWVARRLGVASPGGAALDAVADKVLADAAWLALWWIGHAPSWLALGLVARDVVVVSGWIATRCRGLRYEARPLGQIMTAMEATALGVLLFHGPWWLDVHWPTVGVLLGGVTLALALVSAVEYAVRGPVGADRGAR